MYKDLEWINSEEPSAEDFPEEKLEHVTEGNLASLHMASYTNRRYREYRLAQVEAVNVTTTMIRAPHEVRALKNLLYNGVVENDMLPLPLNVVNNILQQSKFHCIVKKKVEEGFQGRYMNHRLFKFGPLPTKPFKVDIYAVSCDQGWSMYPEARGTRCSCTWGEVDIKDRTGNSKLPERMRVFTNLHAVGDWQTYKLVFKNDEYFMSHLEAGDTLEMYFRSVYDGWSIYVKEAWMTVHYTPPE
eukprot:g8988.t1